MKKMIHQIDKEKRIRYLSQDVQNGFRWCVIHSKNLKHNWNSFLLSNIAEEKLQRFLPAVTA